MLNKSALLSLLLIIVVLYSVKAFNHRESNVKLYYISGLEHYCKQKRDTNWYKLRLKSETKSNLFLNETYTLEECNKLKDKLNHPNVIAHTISSGMVTKIMVGDSPVYQSSSKHFSLVFTAILFWLMTLAIIEKVSNGKST